MRTFKILTKVFLPIMILGMIVYSCSKTDDSISPTSVGEKLSTSDPDIAMTDSVFIQDTTQRTFTIVDHCGFTVGTITTNSWNFQINYYDQTSSTIELYGNGSTVVLNKNEFYYFYPAGCTGSNRILKVKFASGTQTLCSTFSILGCTWSYSAGGCGIISSYAFVSTGPPIC